MSSSPGDSDAIHVAIRVRPLIRREKDAGGQSTNWRVNKNTVSQVINGKPAPSPYIFDHVFDQISTTDDVYLEFAQPVLLSVMEGFNGTIFAYGQTSSGKTHTMMGTPQEPGIIPKAIDEIFDYISNAISREFIICVSYMEIYNEIITDLLRPGNKNLKVHEDQKGTVFVGDLTSLPMSDAASILAVMAEGEKHRHFGETNMNERSSRSHTLFRLAIESRDTNTNNSDANDDDGDEIDGAVRVAQLNLVDLAGSERISATGAEGMRLKEGGHINKSLMTLGLVINKLSEGESFIPFRDSKLTRILQNSLGGNAKTSILCTVTPAAIEETISTLKFASRAKTVKNKPEINEVLTDGTLIKRYKTEIRELKKQLEVGNPHAAIQELQIEKEKMAQMLEEQQRIQRESEEKIKKLTAFFCTSSGTNSPKRTLETASIPKNKRRETWCPGAALFKPKPIPSAAAAAAKLKRTLPPRRVLSSSSSEDGEEFKVIDRDNFIQELDEELERRMSEDNLSQRRVHFELPRSVGDQPVTIEKGVQTEKDPRQKEMEETNSDLRMKLMITTKERDELDELLEQNTANLESMLSSEDYNSHRHLESCRRQLNILTSEKAQMESDFKSRLQQLEEESTNLQLALKATTSERDEAKCDLSEAINDAMAVQNSLFEAQQSVKFYKSRVEELEQENAEITDKVTELELKAQQSPSSEETKTKDLSGEEMIEIETLKETIDQLRQSLHELQGSKDLEVRSLQEQLFESQMDQERVKKDSNSLSALAEQENNELRALIDQKVLQLEDLRKEVEALKVTNQELQVSECEALDNVVKLNELLKLKDEELRNAHKEIKENVTQENVLMQLQSPTAQSATAELEKLQTEYKAFSEQMKAEKEDLRLKCEEQCAVLLVKANEFESLNEKFHLLESLKLEIEKDFTEKQDASKEKFELLQNAKVSLEEELHQKQILLDEANLEIKSFKAKNEELEGTRSVLLANMEEIKNQKASLDEEIAKLQCDLVETKQEIDSISKHNKELQSSKAEVEEKLAEMQESARSMENEEPSQQGEKLESTSNENLSSIMEEREFLQKSLVEEQKAHEDLKNEYNNLLENSKTSLLSQESIMDTQGSNKKEVLEANNDQESKVNNLRKSLDAKIEDLEHMTFLYDEREVEIEEAKLSVEQSRQEQRELKEELEKKQQKIEELHCELEIVEQQLLGAQADKTEAETTVSKLKSVLKEQEAEVIRMQAEGKATRANSIGSDSGQGELLCELELLKCELENAKKFELETTKLQDVLTKRDSEIEQMKGDLEMLQNQNCMSNTRAQQQYRELETRNGQLQVTIDEQATELQKLNEQLDLLTDGDENGDYSEELLQKQKEVETLRGQIEMGKEYLININEEMKAKDFQLEEAEGIRIELEEELLRVQEELETIQNQNEACGQDREERDHELETRNLELQATLEEQELKLKSFQEEVDVLKVRETNIQSEHEDRLRSLQDELAKENNDTKTKYSQLQATASEQEHEIERLREEVGVLKVREASVQSEQEDRLQSLQDELAKENNDTKTKYSELQTTASEQEHEIERLREEVDVLKLREASVQSEQEDRLQLVHDELVKEYNDTNAKYSELQATASEQELQIKRLREELESFRAREDTESCEQALIREKFKEDCQRFQKDNEALESAKSDLQSAYQEQELQLEQLKQELEALKSEYADQCSRHNEEVETIRTHMESDNQQLQKDNLEYKRQISELEFRTEEQANELQRVKYELSSLNTQKDEIESDKVSELLCEVDLLKSELENAKHYQIQHETVLQSAKEKDADIQNLKNELESIMREKELQVQESPEISKSQKEIESLQNEIRKSKIQIQQLEEAILDKDELLEEATKRRDKQEMQLKLLKEGLESVKGTSDSESQEWRSQNSELQSLIKQQEHQLEGLRSELTSVKNAEANQQSLRADELAEARLEIEGLRDEIGKGKAYIQDREDAIKIMQTKLEEAIRQQEADMLGTPEAQRTEGGTIFEEEIATLRQELLESNTNLEMAQGTIASLRRVIKEMEDDEDKQGVDEELEQAKRELSELQRRYHENSAVNEQLKVFIKQQEEEIVKVTSQLQNKEGANSEPSEELLVVKAELQKERENAEKAWEAYDQEKERLEKIVDEQQAEAEESERQIESLRKTAKVAPQQPDVAASSEELANLKVELQKEKEKLEKVWQEFDYEKGRLEKIVDEQEVESEEHQRQIEDLRKKLEQNQGGVASSEELAKVKTELQKEKDKIEKVWQEYDHEKGRLEKIVDEQEVEAEEYQKQIEVLRKQLMQNQNSEIRDLKIQYEAALKEIERLEIHIKKVESSQQGEYLESLRIELANKNMRIHEQQCTIYKQEDQVTGLKKELEYNHTRVNKMHGEIKRLRKEVQEQDSTVQLKKPSNSTSGDEDGGVVSRVAVFSLQAKITQLEVTVQKLTKANEKLEKDRDYQALLKTDKSNQVTVLTSEVQRLKERLSRSRGTKQVEKTVDEQRPALETFNRSAADSDACAQKPTATIDDAPKKAHAPATENRRPQSNWLSPSKTDDMFKKDVPPQCKQQ